ncbi:COPS7B isoform 10, partial [Pongo abelii]
YTDIIQGKLDQRNQLLEVDFCIGRDIRKKDINNIVKTLHEWCDGCEAVLLGIEQQVLRANQYKENHNRTQQQVEAEVTNIKKTLKATASSSAQEMEQQLAERECPPHAEQRQPTKKMSKVKGPSCLLELPANACSPKIFNSWLHLGRDGGTDAPLSAEGPVAASVFSPLLG